MCVEVPRWLVFLLLKIPAQISNGRLGLCSSASGSALLNLKWMVGCGFRNRHVMAEYTQECLSSQP